MADINLSAVVSALNNKADRELENSDRANTIENIATAALNASEASLNVSNACNTLINTTLPTKVNKSGDTFNGNVIVDGNLTVTGEINATITGSSDSAMSATKDSDGNVIVDTYLRKDDWLIHRNHTQTLGASSIEFSHAKNYGHGGYIDFHYPGYDQDFTSRIAELSPGTITITGALRLEDRLNRYTTEYYNDPYTYLVHYIDSDWHHFVGQRRNLNVSVGSGYEAFDSWTSPLPITNVVYGWWMPLTGYNVGVIPNGVSWDSTNLSFRFYGAIGTTRTLSSYGFHIVFY